MQFRRMAMLAGIFAGAWAVAWPAGASGDFGCRPSWTLNRAALDCVSSIALSPGNDSRVNLALLLRDRAGLASQHGEYPASTGNDSYGRNFFDWGMWRGAVYPAQADASDGDYAGSRCISLKGGDAAFGGAVGAAKGLTEDERQKLIAARSQLAPICESFGKAYWLRADNKPTTAPAPAWPVTVTSKAGKEFLAYLIASAAFYGEDWSAARGGFASLAGTKEPWLRQTATYMLARVDLNAAQAASFDQWGSFKGVSASDGAATANAGRELAAYLKAYPAGLYADSARGLQRRVTWLSGDLSGLSHIYEQMLTASTPGSQSEALAIEEADNKLLVAKGAETGIDTPLLLAAYDLMRMRPHGDDSDYGYAEKPLDQAELQAQAPKFAGRQALYDFLLANHAFYVAGNARGVLALIPDGSGAKSFSALEFSRQILRGQALAANKDAGEEAFWQRLIAGASGLYQQPTAELGLALHYQQAGRIGAIFAPGSPIGESMIRKILLYQSADAAILRAQAQNSTRPAAERDLALFTLLYKQLSRGLYTPFLGDLALVHKGADTQSGLWDPTSQDAVPVGLFAFGSWSDGYPCPPLRDTAAKLAGNPQDIPARLCLGDFYRLNGFDGFGTGTEVPKADELGGTPDPFGGGQMARGTFYPPIIANPKARRMDRAYALYRAVMCYGPSGYNSCGGPDVDQSQRKAWFLALKSQYADSSWAKALKYYW